MDPSTRTVATAEVLTWAPSALDLHLFNEGTHFRLYEVLGSHPVMREGVRGVGFRVWAPDATAVSVIGSWNGWDRRSHRLSPAGSSGIWHGFIPGIAPGALYKYAIESRFGGPPLEKADPFAVHQETPPKTASVVWDLAYRWGDAAWMLERGARQRLDAPISIYEVHLGSWRRVPEDRNRALSYREIAPLLADYVRDLGFTHVELLPVMEHPFYGSWGYQVTGYFAPTSRYGTPQDLMYLIDHLHQRGIGVILDWVPSHYPTDGHGLGLFDGSHLFEHADPRKGFHPDWKSYIFNYGRNEVRGFLISSALYWLERYHADGIRVDGVASMLYLDYSRRSGEWIPNAYGGNENLEAIALLKRMNEEIYREHPDVQTYAEESTAWPMVSRPTSMGGLGFGFKWDMGWMHDTLSYMSKDPIHRRFHHQQLTFRMLYGFTENFVLPLSHDEVVHGKGSLLGKMPGDDWQKLANLRLLFGYMFAQPGKKLLFMGGEIGQWREWNHETSLDWHLLEHERHRGIQAWVRALNQLMASEPALFERDATSDGFEWLHCDDAGSSVISLLRKPRHNSPASLIVAAFNFTPVPRTGYRIGVPVGGLYQVVANSDRREYGGTGDFDRRQLIAEPEPQHGRPQSLRLDLPPLGALFLKR
jgi:1,4-alpha-glucan branching enzyme